LHGTLQTNLPQSHRSIITGGLSAIQPKAQLEGNQIRMAISQRRGVQRGMSLTGEKDLFEKKK